MTTPASTEAKKIQSAALAGIQKQLSGPIQTVKSLEDKYSKIKSLYNSTYPVINATEAGLIAMAMKDTPSGDIPGTIAAMATIGVNNGLKAAVNRITAEYNKIKLKLLLPSEFAKTALNGDLGLTTGNFDPAGFFGGITNGVYSIVPDQSLISTVDGELRAAGMKFDYTQFIKG